MARKAIPTAHPPERLLPGSHVDALLGIHRSTRTRWIADGLLPALHIRGRVYVRESDLLALMRPDTREVAA